MIYQGSISHITIFFISYFQMLKLFTEGTQTLTAGSD